MGRIIELMAQNTNVLLAGTGNKYDYTRADFTALRAWLNKLSVAHIAALYYSEDDLEALGCTTTADLLRRLETMRDYLMHRALDQNPHAAEGLRHARINHVWSKAACDFLVRAAEADLSQPKVSDPVSAWMRPRLAQRLKNEGAYTIQGLMDLITVRGAGWYRPIPCLGAGKAAAIVRWLRQYERTLGPLCLASPPLIDAGKRILISPENPALVPLERVILPGALDGSCGFNRNPSFALVAARNDLEAIDAYLYKYRGKEKTERAYRKELERFLLWCITVRSKAMSSIQHEDCEAYKDFLIAPPVTWVGKRTWRLSADWRPFAGPPSTASQKYAVQAIRSFFEWLVNVRYLSGNPWITVGDPAVAQAISPIQIDKALPKSLWQKLCGTEGILDVLCAQSDATLQKRYKMRGAAADISMTAQYRLVKAALLLLGESGIRREEAAFATRDKLKPVQNGSSLWELDVLGKRAKWRTVFIPPHVIRAIEDHWLDRGQDFSDDLAEVPLLSPLVTPATRDAVKKHLTENGRRRERGFSQDGLYRVIKTALRRIAEDTTLNLDDFERAKLRQAGPHAFRHTFGTHAAAGAVPLDVLQRVLGHASLQTTTIYVQAEKQRSIEELGHYFSG